LTPSIVTVSDEQQRLRWNMAAQLLSLRDQVMDSKADETKSFTVDAPTEANWEEAYWYFCWLLRD